MAQGSLSHLSLGGPVSIADPHDKMFKAHCSASGTQKQMGMIIWPTFQKEKTEMDVPQTRVLALVLF